MAGSIEKVQLEELLSSLSPIDVDLTINNNSSTYLSVRKRRKVVEISLHRLFLSAPQEIFQDLIDYAVKGKKKSLSKLRIYAHEYFQNADHSYLLRKRKLQTKGMWVDLEELYRRVNQQYFSSSLDLSITWFDKPNYRRFSSVTFGSYTRHLRLIRINSLLDHPRVPLYFIEFIIYHEMLHDICPPIVDKAGRVRVHTSLFRKKEQEYPLYKKAKEWEEKFLQKRGKLYGRP